MILTGILILLSLATYWYKTPMVDYYYRFQITKKYAEVIQQYVKQHIDNERIITVSNIYKICKTIVNIEVSVDIIPLLESILEKEPAKNIEFFTHIFDDLVKIYNSNASITGESRILIDFLEDVNRRMYEGNNEVNIDSYLNDLLKKDI